MPSQKWVSLFLLIVAQEIFYLCLATFKVFSTHISLFLVIYYLAFVCYLGCVFLSKETTWTPKQWAGIVTASLLFRLTLIGSAPFLSDDLYRFLWEGKLWIHGWNPYVFSPNHSAL